MNYQATSALWVGSSIRYGSGLPFEFEGNRDEAVAQYGRRITDRVNFETGRVRLFMSLDVSAGAVLRRAERGAVQVQAGVSNVTNRFGVINFAGLFSGTALAAPRTLTVQLRVGY
jgi:outer membrane receptor for Fe3+-dicitrate